MILDYKYGEYIKNKYNLANVYCNQFSNTYSRVDLLLDFKNEREYYYIYYCSIELHKPQKYKKSNKNFFLYYKNKIIELDEENVSGNIYPIIPSFVFDNLKQKVLNKEAIKKEKKLVKFENSLSLSALSGEFILNGIDNNCTVNENYLQLDGFQNLSLRIAIYNDKNKFQLGIKKPNTDLFLILGEYTKEEILDLIIKSKNIWL